MSSVSCEIRARFLGLEKLHRPHVVQTVRKFDEHDADVGDHRENHLSTFSACCFSLERLLMWAIFVRPSTRR
jgi:hypothetical protein